MISATSTLEDSSVIDAWRDMAPTDLGPFVLPEWARLWRKHFGDRSELIVVAALSQPEVKPWAVWTLELFENGTVEQLGGREVTDYSAPALLEGRTQVFACELAEYLAAGYPKWKRVHLEAIPADSGFCGPLADEVSARGAKVKMSFDEVCPILELPESYSEYLASLPSKHRHELRRKLRRFESEAGNPEIEVSTEESLEADLEIFFQWHRYSKGPKGGFLDAGYEEFFRDLARTTMDRGWLRFTFLKVGKKRFSACFGFEMGNTYFLYNSAHDAGAVKLSPGIVHLACLIKSGIERGLKRFDFLQGSERYKIELGGMPRRLVSLDISWE